MCKCVDKKKQQKNKCIIKMNLDLMVFILEIICLMMENMLKEYIKDGEYVINLDEYFDIGALWIALHISTKTVTYFDSFGAEHIPKEIKKIINNKNIIANIFRLQAYNSVKCGYFCIGFIDVMLKGNSLIDFTNLFSPNDFKKIDDIILNHFKNRY